VEDKVALGKAFSRRPIQLSPADHNSNSRHNFLPRLEMFDTSDHHPGYNWKFTHKLRTSRLTRILRIREVSGSIFGPGDRLSWLKYFVVFRRPSRRMPGQCLKIRLRPLSTKSFPIHHHSRTIRSWTLQSVVTEKRRTIKNRLSTYKYNARHNLEDQRRYFWSSARLSLEPEQDTFVSLHRTWVLRVNFTASLWMQPVIRYYCILC
jgi:hypothetical protein